MNERHEAGLWCRDVLTLLDTFVDGGLEPAQLSAVRGHLAVCDECSRFGAAYAQVVQALRAAAPVPLDGGTLRRLTERLDQEV